MFYRRSVHKLTERSIQMAPSLGLLLYMRQAESTRDIGTGVQLLPVRTERPGYGGARSGQALPWVTLHSEVNPSGLHPQLPREHPDAGDREQPADLTGQDALHPMPKRVLLRGAGEAE